MKIKKTIYDVKLTTQTPIHIGSGEILEKGLDYAVDNGKIWVLDLDVLWEKLIKQDDTHHNNLSMSTQPAELLRPNDFQPNNPIFSYVIPGQLHSQNGQAPIRSFIKTGFNQPYIPGSSLKGALRTILFRQGYQKIYTTLIEDNLKRDKRWAGQILGEEVFGSNPNKDLLKAFSVADSNGLNANDSLTVLNTYIFSHSREKPKPKPTSIACEFLPADHVLTTTITIDEYYFSDLAKNLGFQSKRDWLTELRNYAVHQATEQLNIAKEYLSYFPDSNGLKKCDDLLNLQLASNQFLVQIGWGGGWNSKTLAFALDSSAKELVMEKYELGKEGFVYSPKIPFPKSRRLIALTREDINSPSLLGWVLVEMVEREGGGRKNL